MRRYLLSTLYYMTIYGPTPPRRAALGVSERETVKTQAAEDGPGRILTIFPFSSVDVKLRSCIAVLIKIRPWIQEVAKLSGSERNIVMFEDGKARWFWY